MFSVLSDAELHELDSRIESAREALWQSRWGPEKSRYIEAARDMNRLLDELEGERASREWK